MKITKELLQSKNACADQVDLFVEAFPNGCSTSVEDLIDAYAAGLDVFWLCCLLPRECVGGARHLALVFAQSVAHLNTDERVIQCLDVVARRVVDPSSVTDADLVAAGNAAWAAARAAAWDAAWAATWEWQIAVLSDFLEAFDVPTEDEK